MIDNGLLVQMLLGALLGLSVYLPLAAGQLSLATPAFYAVGGTLAALLSTRWSVLGAADNAIHQAHVALLNFHASSQTASGVARKRERHQIPKAKAIHHAGHVRRGALSVA